MKVKVYKVYPRNNPDLWYLVDAPFTWVAKWCGAAIVNNSYATFLTDKDMIAERFKTEEG